MHIQNLRRNIEMKKKLLAGWVGIILSIALTVNAFAIDAPSLSVSTSGLDISLSWTSITAATGYTLYYTPNPYKPGLPQMVQYI